MKNRTKLLLYCLCSTLLLTTAGCKKQSDEPVTTSLSLMETVNNKNIVDGSKDMRIWYQINPALFTDKFTDAPGTLKSVAQDIEYFSDGDLKTTEDLNMSGLLLTDVLAVDDNNALTSFKDIDPTIGTIDDLTALCQRGNTFNLPVMLEMNLVCVSKDTPRFQELVNFINGLGEDNPEEKNGELYHAFYVEKDKNEEGWVKIGDTPYYYRAQPQTDNPRINLSSVYWRDDLARAVEQYFAAGVRGFYIPEFNELQNNDVVSATEFMTWFESMTKERNENVINVFSYGGWDDVMSTIPEYAANMNSAGAEGMIAKAATGSISARDLGQYLQDNASHTQGVEATFINNKDGSLDLLKSKSRLPQYKMALALSLMSSGQVFIMCGDELGLTSKEGDLITEAIETPDEENSEEGETIELEFGSLPQQQADGNSIYSFVIQAIKLRDSYASISDATLSWNQDLSTDQVLVLDKRKDSSETVLIFNLSDQNVDVDVSSIQISGLPAELGGVLLTGEEQITQEENILHLPPYSMALLK